MDTPRTQRRGAGMKKNEQDMVKALERAEYFFQNITQTYRGPNYAEAFKAVQSALAKVKKQ